MATQALSAERCPFPTTLPRPAVLRRKLEGREGTSSSGLPSPLPPGFPGAPPVLPTAAWGAARALVEGRAGTTFSGWASVKQEQMDRATPRCSLCSPATPPTLTHPHPPPPVPSEGRRGSCWAGQQVQGPSPEAFQATQREGQIQSHSRWGLGSGPLQMEPYSSKFLR